MVQLSPHACASVIAMLAALLVAGPTAAAVVSSASLTAIAWNLVDLDPLDGIAPGLGLTTVGGNGAFANSLSSLFESHASSGFGSVPEAGANASAPLVTGQTAQAVVTTGMGPGQLMLFASGTSLASAPGSFGRFDATAISRDWAFVLTPHTQVEFYGASNLRAQASGAGPEESFASVALRLSNLPTPSGALPEGLQEVTALHNVNLVTFDGGSRRQLVAVSVDWSNTAAHNATIYLTATAFASGYSEVSPVPEPATGLLLIAGLCLVLRQGKLARNQW